MVFVQDAMMFHNTALIFQNYYIFAKYFPFICLFALVKDTSCLKFQELPDTQPLLVIGVMPQVLSKAAPSSIHWIRASSWLAVIPFQIPHIYSYALLTSKIFRTRNVIMQLYHQKLYIFPCSSDKFENINILTVRIYFTKKNTLYFRCLHRMRIYFAKKVYLFD